MFGSVPRNLWERRLESDAENCIPLATRLLWIEREGDWRDGDREVGAVLVDAGNGDKFDPRTREQFAIEVVPPEGWGVPLDRLTDVIITHLHFDHSGGLTRRTEEGDVEPVFPDAVHHLQRENRDEARAPWARERASYLPENLDPLEQRGSLRLAEGPVELLPGIRVEVVEGHTRGLQWVLVGEGPGAVAFPSDLVPTSRHLHLPWIMGYDRCARTTYDEKAAFLERAVEEDWVVIFEHDPDLAAARIGRDARGRFEVREAVEI